MPRDDIHPERIQGYLDGFAAAVDQVNSIRIHTTFGPSATPVQAERITLEAVKGIMNRTLHTLRESEGDG